MTDFYDALETRDEAQRAADLRTALPRQIARAKALGGYYGQALADVDPANVIDTRQLAALPVLRKSELVDRQTAEPPFGGLCGVDQAELARVFQSPGPIYEPQARTADFWRFARAMHAAGFRPGGLIHNTFAYHFTPAGFMFDSAGAALGCPVFPAGTGQTELQVKAIDQLRPAYYTGTPSFFNALAEKAGEIGADVSSIDQALVTAEPCPPSLVREFAGRGVDIYQCYGTADLGLIAYETKARDGLVVDEGVIVELVKPGTGDPVQPGEIGEVVVTTLNPEYPLIRFATGDLSAALPGPCPTGRTNLRIRGWMGRADQTAKLRGMFVHPPQIAEVVSRHPQIGRARLVIDQENHQDIATLRCEAERAEEGLADAVGETFRAVCRVRAEVSFCEPGSLPEDGKVIEDQRRYE